MQTRTQTRVNRCAHGHVHAYWYKHVYRYTNACAHTHTQKCTRIQMQRSERALTRTYISPHTHTHTHTSALIFVPPQFSQAQTHYQLSNIINPSDIFADSLILISFSFVFTQKCASLLKPTSEWNDDVVYIAPKYGGENTLSTRLYRIPDEFYDVGYITEQLTQNSGVKWRLSK